jgi:hypothetical protein
VCRLNLFVDCRVVHAFRQTDVLVVAGLLTEPLGATAGLPYFPETCGRTLGGVRRPAPNLRPAPNMMNAYCLEFARTGALLTMGCRNPVS